MSLFQFFSFLKKEAFPSPHVIGALLCPYPSWPSRTLTLSLDFVRLLKPHTPAWPLSRVAGTSFEGLIDDSRDAENDSFF